MSLNLYADALFKSKDKLKPNQSIAKYTGCSPIGQNVTVLFFKEKKWQLVHNEIMIVICFWFQAIDGFKGI